MMQLFTVAVSACVLV